jgi:probable LLM family oxidoreductase
MELGIASFVEVTPDPRTGQAIDPVQRFRNLMEEAELADQVGLDVFAVGEHHRWEYISSAPAVVLAAAAERTKRIRLSSAVTVLSTDDPVRVFQAFSTLDLLSGGRAEIIAGRGSFTESFPLFGYDLADYDSLFAEKLDLLLKLRESEHITWSGKHRAALTGQGVYPRPLQDPLPIWIGVGGNPGSAARAATLGLPMTLAIIGGTPDRFVPLIEVYREFGRRAGHDPKQLQLGINSLGLIADSAQEAADLYIPSFLSVMNRIGRERGWSPMSRPHVEAMIEPHGALVVGTPEQAAAKILYEHELFNNDRFILQFNTGALPHATALRAIELFGTKVAPLVRAEVARRTATADSAVSTAS